MPAAPLREVPAVEVTVPMPMAAKPPRPRANFSEWGPILEQPKRRPSCGNITASSSRKIGGNYSFVEAANARHGDAMNPRLPQHGVVGSKNNWKELFLNPVEAGVSTTLAASVAAGHSLLVVESLATEAECASLSKDASQAAHIERETKCIDGIVRKKVVELVGAESTALCDELLLRHLALLDTSIAPSLTSELFGDALTSSPTTCFRNPRLAWSVGEPAINVYNPGGCFTPHEDEQSITCLVNLSQQSSYTGGGTAFWSIKDAGPGRSRCDDTPPTYLIAPAVGTALIFGGTVTHAAQPVVTGERIVFVASFSPTSRLGPKRTRALQAGFGMLRQFRRAPGDAPAGADVECQQAVEECTLDELCDALATTNTSSSSEDLSDAAPALAAFSTMNEEVD